MKNNILSSMLIFNSLVLFGSAEGDINALSTKLAASCTISDVNEQSGEHLQTKLITAAGLGNNETVIDLISKLASPYLTDKYGNTALMYAAHNKKADTIAVLLGLCDNRKALLNQKNFSGQTALDIACIQNDIKIITILAQAQHRTKFGPTCITHFSPNILQAILNCINNEQESITSAMYRFTHGRPARAMVAKHLAGVRIALVVHHQYTDDFCIALRYMINNGIQVKESTISPDLVKRRFYNMHNKYIIFNRNAKNKPLLITGSCNLTDHAFSKNWENIIITDDTNAIAKFLEQHEHLDRNSKLIDIRYCRSSKDDDPYQWKKQGRIDNEIENLA